MVWTVGRADHSKKRGISAAVGGLRGPASRVIYRVRRRRIREIRSTSRWAAS